MAFRASRRYGLSRRDVIKTAVGAAVAVGPFFHVTPARAAKRLKILQWSHFVPATTSGSTTPTPRNGAPSTAPKWSSTTSTSA